MASGKGVQSEVARETKLPKETAQTHPQKGKSVEERNADVTLRLLEEHGDKFGPLTPEAEKKLRRKLYLRVMLLLSAINIMLFVDKSTLGYAAILGLFEETGIRQTEYNNLNTMFYVGTGRTLSSQAHTPWLIDELGYLVFQWPGHYLMQRLPFGKYVATTVFCWSVIIFLHCVATRYAGLVVMRLALGAAEAVIVPAMEITIGMFFNRHEQSFLQPVLWITCQAAPMVTGFISYGLLWATGPVLPWKLLYIVTGGLTLLLAVWVWIHYPMRRIKKRWLTLEEKVQVIRRVHAAQQSSIEQKRFKREQFGRDAAGPRVVAFRTAVVHAHVLEQSQLRAEEPHHDVDRCQPAGVNARGGGRRGVRRGVLRCGDVRAAAVAAQPGATRDRVVHAGGGGRRGHGDGDLGAEDWAPGVPHPRGVDVRRHVHHRARVDDVNGGWIWVAGNGPRFYGAWASMISVSWVGTPIILWIIRFILARRNAERLAYIAGLSDDEREGFVETVGEEGEVVRTKVNLAVLDLTDLQNKQFIYPL
ncbi:cysteine transporter [Verticillium alfalfae VaMs.102]|uniref:Cysteine transporter n=1 Tax=Verticillium alfalfae (strain VaMs.102 / ATCC MYA-4576 / FGSC 10136) TaxID=526221 RepID=C9SGS1_VERA1|nr:cysteine transporter [Verticillium alfalfae VaMs.102]EEY18165.1 cysteine transporter [Verticillium alfalfae VaMs.102]